MHRLGMASAASCSACHCTAGRRLSHRGMLRGLQERPLLLVPVACILAISLWTLLAPWGCHDSIKVGASLPHACKHVMRHQLLHRVILRALTSSCCQV